MFRPLVIIFTLMLLMMAPGFAQEAEYDADGYRINKSENPASPVFLEGKVSKQHKLNDRELKADNSDLPGLGGKAVENALADEDRDLLIEWDKWRNKFSKKIWIKLNEKLVGGLFIPLGSFGIAMGEGGGYNFKHGTQATFVCDILNDQTIANVRITAPSGDAVFDRLVIKCVYALDGKDMLKFPKGSKRERVRMSNTFAIGLPVFHETKYGDREFVKVSDGSY
jgi:hypothetical protein